MIIHILILAIISIQLLIVILAYRNSRVCDFRCLLNEHVFSFLDYEWRYKVKESVSYRYMLLTFWKSLKAENYYSDTSFLK